MGDFKKVESMFKLMGDALDKNVKKNNDKKHGVSNTEKKKKCLKNVKKDVDKFQVKNQISKRSPVNKEIKILNTEMVLDGYTDVLDSFETVLNDMKVDRNSRPKILEKLQSIQKIIQIKIKHLTAEDELNKDIFTELSRCPLSTNLLSTYTESLCSVSSNSSVSEDKISYKEFFFRVSCPFCSQMQIDKIHFIKHLNENCESFRSRNFQKKDNHTPYSFFQILPNNTFKCNVCPKFVAHNIKYYFTHMTSFQHKNSCSQSKRVKNSTEDLFCSACKMLIPNTYVQLECHISHPMHDKICNETDLSDFLSSKQISLAYVNFRRFKCFICHHIVKPTLPDLLEHCNTNTHRQNMKKLFWASDLIYCKFCHITYDMPPDFQFHLFSSKHKQEERKFNGRDSEESFELCFYCGLKTPNLMELCTHMAFHCDEMESIKISYLNLKSDEKDLKVNAVEKKEESAVNVIEPKSNEEMDEYCICVKDCTEFKKVFQVLKFFDVLEDVVRFKLRHNKTLMIQFKKRETFVKVLTNWKAIGDKLDMEISRLDRYQSESDEDEPETDSSDSDSVSSSEDEKSVDLSWGDKDIQSLFQRVSSHLFNLTEKLGSNADQLIAEHFTLTLKCKKCITLGFGAEGLSFPTDTISFFCDFESSDSKNQQNLSLGYSQKFSDDLISKCHSKLSDSKLWEDIEIIKIPWLCIKCKHVETRKTCTVSFDRAFVELTNMLRSILVQNKNFQPFFLIVRLWFAIKKFSLGDSDYPLISLLIFFLTNSRMASLELASDSIAGRVLSLLVKETSEESRKTVTVPGISELFKNFLKFLHNFDFDNNGIYLPLNRPVSKQILFSDWFKHSSKVPEIASSYLCILISSYSINFGSYVDEKEFQSILKTAQKTVKHYKQ